MELLPGSLLRRPSLLPLQTCEDVQRAQSEGIPPCPPLFNILCRHHGDPHHFDHSQRVHVHVQFQYRSETLYLETEAGK